MGTSTSKTKVVQRDFDKAVSAIVLAAGLSSRMGDRNKLLLSLNNESLIKRTLSTITDHNFVEVVVVLGHEYEQIKPEVEGFVVTTILNEDYRQGQMTSVHAGMKALSQPTDGVMVFLADLALIDNDDLIELRLAFDKCNTGVVVPTYKGKRGNPIILSLTQSESVVAQDKNLGCKRLIEKNPELVTPVEMSRDHVVVDMDTPAAYEKVVERLKNPNLKRVNSSPLESV